MPINNTAYHILVVDDSPDSLKAVSYFLQNNFPSSTHERVPSGETAIEAIDRNAPDLVLLDWKLPGIQGSEVLKYIRGNTITQDIPVVVMTGLSDSHHMQDAFVLGASDFVKKPVDPVELKARLLVALRHSGYLKELKVQSEELQAITKEQLQTKERLTESEQMLIRINNSKDKLLSIITHDIKNPLTSIRIFTGMLLEKAKYFDKGEIDELLPDFQNSLQATITLLNNLLQWSNSQMNIFTPVPERFSLKLLVIKSMMPLKAEAARKKVFLMIEIPDNISVVADRSMVSFIVRNLVSNAIKFSHPHSSVKIEAAAANGMVRIAVKDRGVGMDEAKASELFANPYNLSTVGTLGEQGTGLGLMLCHEFVVKNNGTIGLETEAGKGTEFWFALPS